MRQNGAFGPPQNSEKLAEMPVKWSNSLNLRLEWLVLVAERKELKIAGPQEIKAEWAW